MLIQKSFQLNQDGPHMYPRSGEYAPKWYIIDAKNQVVGRIATIIARVLTGKHKPTYTKHADAGDFVVVLNAQHVVFTRNKWKDKMYYDYSGYVGGLKAKTAQELLEKHPEQILERAVWGMMNKSHLARRQIKKLKIYVGEEHPHKAQNPEILSDHIVRRTVLERNA
jgi:large subunit ribosomal protein L13